MIKRNNYILFNKNKNLFPFFSSPVASASFSSRSMSTFSFSCSFWAIPFPLFEISIDHLRICLYSFQ